MKIVQWCNDNQGFLSAVISIIAVVAAIGIPTYIAIRQDKIALFEKRYLVLQYILKVLRFANEISSGNFKNETLGDIPELKAWAVIQVIDDGNVEDISFIPTPGKKPIKTTKELLRRDVHILRRQLGNDMIILTQGCPLFAEPIRSEIEILNNSYSEYVLSLLRDYLGIAIKENSSAQLKDDFLVISDRFKGNSKPMRSIQRVIKL